VRSRTVPILAAGLLLVTLSGCGRGSDSYQQAAVLIGPPAPPPTPLRQQVVIATSNLTQLGDVGGKYADVFAGVQQDNRAGVVTLYVTDKTRGESMANEVRENHPEAPDVRITVQQCRFTLTAMAKTAAHIAQLGNTSTFLFPISGTSVEPDGEGILVTASAEAAASPAFRKQLTDAAAPMRVQLISTG
jgi:hypothetical protein